MYAYGQDRAVAILKPGSKVEAIEEEHRTLERLRNLGLPTVNDKIITVDGKPAVLYDRFEVGSKSMVKTKNGRPRVVGKENIHLLNEKSISDLKAIKRAMLEKGICINDLQFLISKDGRVVVADPIGVEQRSPSKVNLDTINLLIGLAQENLSNGGNLK